MMHLYWVALKSIWAKEIHRFMLIWVQTLVPPVITMTLYFIIFGNLIGSRIGDMHGFSYMQFIVPGLIMMSVITNAYANVASSFFGAKFQRNIEELLVAPVPTHVIIAGYVGGKDGVGTGAEAAIDEVGVGKRAHHKKGQKTDQKQKGDEEFFGKFRIMHRTP